VAAGTVKGRASLAVVSVLLALYGLYHARPVAVPLLLAVFLAALARPLVLTISRRLPEWLSVLLVLAGLVALVAPAGVLLVFTVGDMADRLPAYAERLESLLDSGIQFLEARGFDVDPQDLGFEGGLTTALQFAGGGLTSVLGVLANIAVVIVLAVFALLEWGGVASRLDSAIGAERASEIRKAVAPMLSAVSGYLRTKTLVSLATGVVAYSVALAIGIDFAFVWGVLVFVLNFIPYVGPVAAVVPPVTVAFLQYDNPLRGFLALAALGTSQTISGLVVEPRIVGQQLRMSPFLVLVSMLFWGWFWGLAGVVLAVPLSAALVIACWHVERLRPLAVVLGAPRGSPRVP
jgi:predicted PurR-regulated permease PerM